MLRWFLGGREAQSSVERSGVLSIGEEQPRNCFTELQVLKGHFDIVRFLVQIDDFRLQELRGHTQQITAIITFTCEAAAHTGLITASSDRSVSCLLGLERLCLWVSGGEELCVWSKDFQLRCLQQTHGDSGVTALIELPKNHLAAAVDREIVIYKLMFSDDSDVSITKIRCLSDHRDQIRALINVNDRLFASGSHAGELILWDAVDWNVLKYEHILWEESQTGVQSESRLKALRPSEMSIQHLTTNGQLILAAVGSGLYVYDLQSQSVAAYRKAAHDSNVLHTMLLSDSELMSCSEDGSVRMWEIQDLPLPAEPASAGFFGNWTFGRSSKQAAPPSKKATDFPNTRKLELIGDLIGHSGAVQMFVGFGEDGLVTCSADHLLILWKNGERQSRLRSQALFQKLEENGGL
uniref:WD repeat domain 41 n=1 Tax=Oryzias sinensis TaxID=183150 RepID=A0A8C7XD72_9TELE